MSSRKLQQLVGVGYDGDQAHVFVVQLAKVIEFSGVAIIVGGIILAAVNFVRDGLRLRDWVFEVDPGPGTMDRRS